MIKQQKKLPVAIYTRYVPEKDENALDKENFLYEYCKKKGYRIVQMFRDFEPNREHYSNNLLSIISTKIFKYKKLIILDICELAKTDFQLISLYQVLADRGISIETVKNGLFGEDLLFGVTIHKNVMNKEDLKKVQSLNFEKSIF